MMRLPTLLLFAASTLAAQQHSRDPDIHNPDTRAWWHTTETLSNDSMEGRDTGTPAYQHAAEYVAKRLEAAGLKPAGEGGTYFQNVPMHQAEIDAASAVVSVSFGDRSTHKLRFLEDITSNVPDAADANVGGELVFRGYCGKDAMSGVGGKVVICFGTQRAGLPSAGQRAANARTAGAAAIINVDDPYFTIEPPRWPFAYARTVTLKGKEPEHYFPTFRCSAETFAMLLSSTPHDAQAILKAGGAKQPLESFDLPGRSFSAHLETKERETSSPNVLALLPGTDATLKDEYVVIAAHLDGYGYGTPVSGDNLYNGTLDDAAYVALLIQMADDIKAGKLPRPKRSILFCAFTGEEKGLLGSNWFVAHPTVPITQMAADINLDQLRPLFPLTILTAPGRDNTTLGATASEVGAKMGIEIRDDREPERGLLRRADNFPFLKAGVPAIGFIFGYDPGTDAEKRYREWYQVRYHRPQDDLTQPMDFDAATKFNTFFYKLVDTVASAQERPKVIRPLQ